VSVCLSVLSVPSRWLTASLAGLQLAMVYGQQTNKLVFSGEILSHLTMYSFIGDRVKKMTLFVAVVYSKFLLNLETSRKFRHIYLHMRWLLFITAHYVCVGVYSYNYDAKHNIRDLLFPKATYLIQFKCVVRAIKANIYTVHTSTLWISLHSLHIWISYIN